jgi:hypothetical protein
MEITALFLSFPSPFSNAELAAIFNLMAANGESTKQWR